LENIRGVGEILDKSSGAILGRARYDLDYRAPQQHRLGGFDASVIDVDHETANSAMQKGNVLTLKTTQGYVDFFVSRLSMSSSGGFSVGVTMTGGFRDTL